MIKKKNTGVPKNDNTVAAILIALVVVGIIVYVIASRGKEAPKVSLPAPVQTEQVTRPVEQQVESQEAPVSVPVATEETEEQFSGTGGKIAIIIDDWGQTTANCKYLKEIPQPLAVSILPGLRHTKDVANCAALYHKVAMLHLPLEALHNYDFYPPNYIIKTTMKPELVTQIVEKDLDQLPSIEGVNNHMGSKATADRNLMKIIFKIIKKRGLFFVDSMTSRYSVSAALADEMGLSYSKRDVFLDNVNTREAITKQLMVLAQRARRKGYAVAIGHDRHLTMQVLKDEIPLLVAQGFQFVSIKDLLHSR